MTRPDEEPSRRTVLLAAIDDEFTRDQTEEERRAWWAALEKLRPVEPFRNTTDFEKKCEARHLVEKEDAALRKSVAQEMKAQAEQLLRGLQHQLRIPRPGDVNVRATHKDLDSAVRTAFDALIESGGHAREAWVERVVRTTTTTDNLIIQGDETDESGASTHTHTVFLSSPWKHEAPK